MYEMGQSHSTTAVMALKVGFLERHTKQCVRHSKNFANVSISIALLLPLISEINGSVTVDAGRAMTCSLSIALGSGWHGVNVCSCQREHSG